MRSLWLAATLLALPLADAQAQPPGSPRPIPFNCRGVLDTSLWESRSQGRWWANWVELRSNAAQPMQVVITHPSRDPIQTPVIRMAPGERTRLLLSRTHDEIPGSVLQAITSFNCTALN